jgi:hypothetical protein
MAESASLPGNSSQTSPNETVKSEQAKDPNRPEDPTPFPKIVRTEDRYDKEPTNLGVSADSIPANNYDENGQATLRENNDQKIRAIEQKIQRLSQQEKQIENTPAD